MLVTVSNKGIEISLIGSPLPINSKLKWEIGLNYARNRNLVRGIGRRIGHLYTPKNDVVYTSIAKVGQPYGTLYGNWVCACT